MWSQRLGMFAVVAASLIPTTVLAHQDPPGCGGVNAILQVRVLATAGALVTGPVRECETVAVEAELAWGGGCLIQGGSITLHLPSGESVVVENPVPCLGDATVDAEGCLVGQPSSVLSRRIGYTVDPADVASGQIMFSADWELGVAHVASSNVPTSASRSAAVAVDGNECETAPAVSVEPVGGEIVVATGDNLGRRWDVGVDDTGAFVVVWKVDASTGPDTDLGTIRAQRFDPAGAALGGTIQVNTYTTGEQTSPSVSVTPGGEFVVAWESDPRGSAGYGIRARSFGADGVPIGPDWPVSSQVAEVGPSVATNGIGPVTIVWHGWGGPVSGRQFERSGDPLTAEFQVSEPSTYAIYPTVAMGADGRFAVVWDGNHETMVRFYQPWAAPKAGATVALQKPGDVILCAGAMNGRGDLVTSGLNPGNSENYPHNVNEVLLRRFDPNGIPLREPSLASERSALTTTNWPDVGIDGNGNAIVVFWEEVHDPDDFFNNEYHVAYRLYDSVGLAGGPQVRLNLVPASFTSNPFGYPRIAVNDSGQGVVVWGRGGVLRARLFNIATAPLAGATVATGVFGLTESFTPLPPYPFTGTLTFDDVTYEAFGNSVNLGQSGLGVMDMSGTAGVFAGTPPATSFTASASASSASALDLDLDVAGNVICTSSTCTGDFSASFVGLFSNIDDPTGLLPANPDITYVDDGFVDCTVGATSSDCVGTFAINAFRGSATPPSEAPISQVFTYLIDDPLVGNEQAMSVAVQFESVETAGVTLVTSQSNTPNFGLGLDPELTERFDVSTTAGVSAPIRICVHYDDDNLDSVVNFLGAPVSECSLRFYHEEDVGNGPEFVDRTLDVTDPLCPAINPLSRCRGGAACLDRVANRLCGKVDTLSPFAVAGARGVPVSARKLVMVDKLAAADKAKVVFVSKDGAAGITKGAGTDVEAITVRVDLGYDEAHAMFVLPPGASDGTAGWVANSDAVAKYVNRTAPAGAGGTKVAVVKPGKLLKLVAKSLGDTPIDLAAAGPPVGPVTVSYRIANGPDAVVHCSEFPPAQCAFKAIAGGTGHKLVCKNGAPGECG